MGASDPLIFIVSGPGGVGKGTIVDALVRRDPTLWLSRSWTTREQRPGEADGAYVFVDSRRSSSSASSAAGSSSGPTSSATTTARRTPSRLAGHDTVLEIEVDGARQVKAVCPRGGADLRAPADARGAGPAAARARRPRGQGRPADPQGGGGGADRTGDGRSRRRQRRSRAHTSTRCSAIIEHHRVAHAVGADGQHTTQSRHAQPR